MANAGCRAKGAGGGGDSQVSTICSYSFAVINIIQLNFFEACRCAQRGKIRNRVESTIIHIQI